MAVSVPNQVLADLQSGGVEQSLWPALVALARYESNWTAGAKGDYTLDYKTYYHASVAPPGSWPTSFGYLQMNINGLGSGHAPSNLLNGPYNLRLGAQYIRNRLAAGASMWDAMQPWSVRPTAYPFYEQILREGIAGVGGITPAPVDPAQPGSINFAREGLALVLLVALALALH